MSEKRKLLPAATAAGGLFLLLAVMVTWPLAVTGSPHDHVDTLFNSWLISWNTHAVLSGENPLNLPIFAGFPDGNGRNDLLLVQSAAALPMQTAGMDPVHIHNLLLVLSLAFAGFAAAVLAAETGASPPGWLFTGSVVVLLPYFQSHVWHIQLFSAGFSILAIVYALRTLKGKTTGWQLGVLVLLQCLSSLYLWYFLNLAILLLLVTAFFLKQRKKLLPAGIWWTAGNLASLLFLIPHIKNAQAWPTDTIASTDVLAFLAPWGNSTVLGWMRAGSVHPEAALWPGLAVIAGSIWFLLRGKKNRWDIFLLACVVFFSVFSLGPVLVAGGKALAPAPFRILALLPGCSSIRLPARAGIFALVPLAVFAGRKLQEKPGLAVLGILFTAAAVWHPPIETIPLGSQPWQQWIAHRNFQRILYLPVSSDLDRPEIETERLAGSTCCFTPSVNGYSTTLPAEYDEYAQVLNQWPSEEADSLLRELRVDCIIIEGRQPPQADTVFFDGRIHVSVVVTHIN
ncbi:MAG: hypothetical protein J7K88_00860 [Candidatus Fermentibacteraceae bacterium]|nr:hypothetical protein [Candidatus Fermentibacteraceae bacterium]